jgi:alpha-glucosidase
MRPPLLERYIAYDTLTHVTKIERGFEAQLGVERFKVEVITPGVVRLKISQGGVFEETPTHSLTIDPLSAPVPKFELSSGPVTTLTTTELKVSVTLSPFSVSVHRADGSAVFETYENNAYSTLNDAWVMRRKLGKNDPIYGLGEKSGSHNRRGREFTLWNTDVLNPTATGEFVSALESDDPRSDQTSVEFDPYYISIPFFYHQDAQSSKISGSFIDNSYRGYYDFSEDGSYLIHFAGGEYTEYVFAGPSMWQVLDGYTWLTGRMALPPIWALGYHHCRWQPYAQQDVEDLVAKHRALELPLDTFWIDIDYMNGYRVFTWDKARYPDPEALMASLKSQGVRTITIVDPGVKYDPGYEVFDDGMAKDVFAKTETGNVYIGQVWPGNTAFPDFTKSSARAWWGDLNAKWVQSGLAGIWNDMNEPATGEIDPTPMRFNDAKYPHARYHNEYAMLMAMGTTDGLREAMPNLRTFVLSRAGSPGIQRYAANWLGDNMSRWDHLWLAAPMGSGLGISGQPFVGADIGGFGDDCNEELLIRWMQFGNLTPFARNHNMAGRVDQYPWSFGEEALGIIRSAINLRYRLMPYIYSAFVKASATGVPIQRPLVFDYQDDEQVRDIDDEYMFGESLLVAPIYEPGARSREVYLPAGTWVNFFTREVYEGGKSHKVAAPIEHIPVFVKAGAAITMWPEVPQSTDGYRPETLDVLVFSGFGVTEVIEDDGLTFDNRRITTKISVTPSGVEIEAEGETFDGFVRTGYNVIDAFTGETKHVAL